MAKSPHPNAWTKICIVYIYLLNNNIVANEIELDGFDGYVQTDTNISNACTKCV